MAQLSDFSLCVSEFMSDFGADAFLVCQSLGGVYDPATSAFTPTTTKKYKVRVIFMDMLKPKDGIGRQAGSLIQDGDKMIYVQPIANELPLPQIQPNKDVLKIGTDTWSIVTEKEVNPAQSGAILLELYVRK